MSHLRRLVVYVSRFLSIHYRGVLDSHVYTVVTLDTMGIYACARSATYHIINMYVVELGDELVFGVGGSSSFPPRRPIDIVTLEDDSFVGDVGHHNIRDINLLCLTPTTYSALEAKTGVGARESALSHHKALGATHVLTTYDKSAMGMIYGIVLNKNILTTIYQRFLLVFATLHAQSVITGIHR